MADFFATLGSARHGTRNASRNPVSSVLAVLAERDAALRQLMALALKSAGCDVRQCSNALQLKAELYSSPIHSWDRAILVLNVEIAAQCVSELAAMTRVRANEHVPRADFVFVCEFGGLKRFMAPGLDESSIIRVLEKPFDLDELERIARTHSPSSRSAPGALG
jgi:hypothetical protein